MERRIGQIAIGMHQQQSKYCLVILAIRFSCDNMLLIMMTMRYQGKSKNVYLPKKAIVRRFLLPKRRHVLRIICVGCLHLLLN